MMFTERINLREIWNVTLPSVIFTALFLVSAWPLLAGENLIQTTNTNQIQLMLAILIPVSMVLLLNDVLNQLISIRSFALIAIFVSLAVALRPLGLGVAGLEPIWVAIILAGYTLGISAGFIVGGLALMLSALVTGGVGPWLGNQMVLAALIGAGAGVIGRVSISRLIISVYAFITTYFFGWFMNLWFWPTFSNLQSAIAFDATSSIAERVSAWAKFSLLTSSGFDVPRALLSATLVWLSARRIRSTVTRLNAPFTTEP